MKIANSSGVKHSLPVNPPVDAHLQFERQVRLGVQGPSSAACMRTYAKNLRDEADSWEAMATIAEKHPEQEQFLYRLFNRLTRGTFTA